MNARAARDDRFVPILVGIGSVAACFAAVEAVVRAGAINRFILPPPTEVIASIPRLFTEEGIADRFAETAQECLLAMVLLTVIGVAAGTVLSRLPILRLATETWIAALAAAPLVLMYPLFLVIFGRNTMTIVIMGLVAGLPPVILKTIEGLVAMRPTLRNVGRSFNLTPWQMFHMIELPAAMPTIFVGLRLGLVFALINIVGVEFLINFGGLGQIINDLAERYDMPGVYAAILFVVIVSVLFFMATEWAERWLTRRT